MSKAQGFSTGQGPRKMDIKKPKSVSFKNPISTVKYYNKNDPAVITNTTNTFELNFSACKLISDTTSKNTLPYVRITLGDKTNGFITVALLDTGCSWSICEFKTFIKMIG